MDKLRLKISVALNRNHALSLKDLEALKPLVERGIAACLPELLHVDTIKVTRIREASDAASDEQGNV